MNISGSGVRSGSILGDGGSGSLAVEGDIFGGGFRHDRLGRMQVIIIFNRTR